MSDIAAVHATVQLGEKRYDLEIHGEPIYQVTFAGVLVPDHHLYSPTTGRTITKPKEIALGLAPYYKSLADDVGATRYREWADVGLTRRTVDRRFGRAFHQAVQRTERIHFTLDGIDDVTDAIRRGRAGFSLGNMTNAELHYLVTAPERLAKTIFYRNGQVDNLIFNLLNQLGYHR